MSDSSTAGATVTSENESPAPEWLLKLETRRQNLSRGKLGHESGAGAACTLCGSGCPGLDLHFWRKVCRNCKCRKEQHECTDDDLSGWAQFVILGQIRSKPAYIKIQAMAENPIKVDWLPPNVPSDLASDYLTQLGSDHIPVTGSEAAAKRKQQLEYQVPPHDLEATLCHNLTENEMVQMTQYVDQLRNNCVGQGSVVRIRAPICYSTTHHMPDVGEHDDSNALPPLPALPQTPAKNGAQNALAGDADAFLSPLPAKLSARRGQELMHQDTPMRRVKMNATPAMYLQSDALPSTSVLHSDAANAQGVLHSPAASLGKNGTIDTAGKKGGIIPSKSNDSGFDSLPPTPNLATYPGILDQSHAENATGHPTVQQFQKAQPGSFNQVPFIENMNMYPAVANSAGRVEQSAASDCPPDATSDQLATAMAALTVWQCHECQLAISAGEIAVKADRAGCETAWHPKCFVCHQCHELLADLVYFFHGGNVYCGRDLAQILSIPRCNACDELIFTKEYTAAEGATFHIKHFCCLACDTPLAGKQYVPDTGSNMPLCLACYEQHYAERCHQCGLVIGPAEQGVSWGKVHWHGGCFVCSGIGCGKSLIGGRFCVKSEMPFCSQPCVSSRIGQ